MTTLVGLVLVIVVLALILTLFPQIAMPPALRQALVIVATILLVLWLLSLLGVIAPFGPVVVVHHGGR